MKNVLVFTLLFFAACAGNNANEQPPGQSAPASTGTAWSTQGGPASPGSPAMGTVTTTDGGADSGKPTTH
jgi:hypothetical protein